MISTSIHGITGFYIADIVDHESFITREVIFTSDRGEKFKVTMFADKGDEHKLDPRIPTKEFCVNHSI